MQFDSAYEKLSQGILVDKNIELLSSMQFFKADIRYYIDLEYLEPNQPVNDNQHVSC